MKNVTQEYLEAQKSRVIKPVRRVELLLRMADGSGWSTNVLDITNETLNLERLSWKLDTDALNQFKSNNIRIRVDNSQRQWDEDSSRFNGFLLFRSKIKIYLGLALESGEEVFPMFTGVINDVIETSQDASVDLDILSLDVLLEDAEAKTAAIKVTNELLGIGDGAQTTFNLPQYPTGEVTEVRVNGAAKRFGIDVTVSGLNDPAAAAEITFQLTPPPLGAEVRADYIVWKTGQPIEDVVKDLLDSIPQVETLLIDPVSFETEIGGNVFNLERTILHTTQSDFSLYSLHNAKVIAEDPPPQNDGQLTIDAFDTETRWKSALGLNVNYKRVPNGICPLWTSQFEADYLPAVEKQQVEGDASDPWQETVGSGVSRSVSGSVLTVNLPQQTGASYRLVNPKLSSPSNGQHVSVHIKVNSMTANVLQDNGIYIGTMKPSFVADNQGAEIIIRTQNQVYVRSGAALFGPYSVDLSSFHTLRIGFVATSFTTGVWNFYVDGVFIAEGPLGAASSFAEQGVYFKASVTQAANFEVDYLRFFSGEITPPQAIWEKVIDFGPHLKGLTEASILSTLGPFYAVTQGASSGVQCFVSFSQDGISYGFETLVSIGSSLGGFTSLSRPRYMKFRIRLYSSEESQQNGLIALYLPALAVSPVIDGGPGIVSWDKLESVRFNGSGGIYRFTAASQDSSNWNYYSALGAADEILSDDMAVSQSQPIPQKLIAITLLNTAGTDLTRLQDNRITLHTDVIVLSMSNYGSLSVWSALEELSRIADFEIGLDGEGRFFFRNKTQNVDPVLTFNENNVEEVISFVPGWDRVYNSIRARFGDFEQTANSATESDPQPTSEERYGTRTLSVGGGSLLLQEDVDLAAVAAKRYYARYKEPKKRMTLVTHFRPELELGDRVLYSITTPRKIAGTFTAKVLGIAHDLINFRTELDLLEV